MDICEGRYEENMWAKHNGCKKTANRLLTCIPFCMLVGKSNEWHSIRRTRNAHEGKKLGKPYVKGKVHP
jgi:hypothetical protein